MKPFKKLTKNSVLIICMILLVPTLVVGSLFQAISTVLTPIPLNMLEFINVYYTNLVANNLPLYSDWQEFPFNVNIYPPIYFLLTGLIQKVSPFSTITTLRIFTLFLEIISGCIGYLIVKTITKNTHSSLLFLILWMCFLRIYPLQGVVRIDQLSLFLVALTTLLTLNLTQSSHKAVRLIIVLIATLAVLSKQTTLLPLSVLFISLGKKKHMSMNTSAFLLLSTVLLSTATITSIHLISNADVLFQLFIILAKTNYNPSALLDLRRLLTPPHIILWILFLPSLLSKKATWLKYLTVCSIAWGIFAFTKVGSSYNYFYEPYFFICLVVSIALTKQDISKLKTFLVSALVLISSFTIKGYGGIDPIVQQKISMNYQNNTNFIQETRKPLFTTESYFLHASSDTIHAIDPLSLDIVLEHFPQKSQKLERAFEEHFFDTIVLETSYSTILPTLTTTISRYYEKTDQIELIPSISYLEILKPDSPLNNQLKDD